MTVPTHVPRPNPARSTVFQNCFIPKSSPHGDVRSWPFCQQFNAWHSDSMPSRQSQLNNATHAIHRFVIDVDQCQRVRIGCESLLIVIPNQCGSFPINANRSLVPVPIDVVSLFGGGPRISEGREIRTPNLLIWSQTRYRCAIPPMVSLSLIRAIQF